MKVLISGVLIAALAATSASAAITVEQRKAACEKSGDKVWVNSTQTCIPKNPCNDEKFRAYCKDLFLTSYKKVPYGANITPAEVINIYAKHTGLKCSVAESEIFESDDFMYVPCTGDDYIVFLFAGDDEHGNVTDVLCSIGHASKQVYHLGYPTICKDMDEATCNTIKSLVGDRVRVEFVKQKNSDEMQCEIGEWGPEVYKGTIYNGTIEAW